MSGLNPTIVMAAGKGSRMKAGADVPEEVLREARSRPKAMIRIGREGRPLLDHLLRQLRREGCRAACVVLSMEDDITEPHFRSHPVEGLALEFITQPIPPGRTKPAGTADAVQRALEAMDHWRGHSVTVANGDNLPPRGMFEVLFSRECALPAFHPGHLGLPADRILAFAVILSDGSGRLKGIIEKPDEREVERSRWPDGHPRVSMNYFRVPFSDLLEAVRTVPEHPVRLERELPEAISRSMVEGRTPMEVISMAGAFLDLTGPEDIEKSGKAIDEGGFGLIP